MTAKLASSWLLLASVGLLLLHHPSCQAKYLQFAMRASNMCARMPVLAASQNPLCCNGENGYAFTAPKADLLLVNGGYQPRIAMASNTWVRWRMLFSGSKGWSTFQILTHDLKKAPECELQLLSKDG